MTRKVVLDTETTGREKDDRLVEIGLLAIDNNGEELDQLHYYLNPQHHVDAAAQRVHKLSNQFLKDKDLFGDVAAKIADFLRDSCVIIHNAAFDCYYLNYEFALWAQRAQQSFIPMQKLCPEIVDTLALARARFPGQPNNLNALIERFNIEDRSRAERHGALIDARLLARVYITLSTNQADLVLDGRSKALPEEAVDVSSLGPFKVTPPTAEEQRAHEALMQELA